MLCLISFKSSLLVEVWEDEDSKVFHYKIDNFTFPLSNALNKFNSSNSLTVQGHHKVGKLTLSYGNMTTDPTPNNSMECPMPNSMECPMSKSMACPTSSTFTHANFSNPTTAPCQCNSVECPTPSTSTQTHQGP